MTQQRLTSREWLRKLHEAHPKARIVKSASGHLYAHVYTTQDGHRIDREVGEWCAPYLWTIDAVQSSSQSSSSSSSGGPKW